MTITTHQLRTIQSEESVIGCQLHYKALAEYAAQTLSSAYDLYAKLTTHGEMLAQLRDNLTHRWHTAPTCSKSNVRCLNGECGCSYKDFIDYWNYLQSYKKLGYRFDSAVIRYRDLQTVCRYVIQPRFAQLLRDYDIRSNFIDTLVCLDELSEEERWVFHNVGGLFHGSPRELLLTLGEKRAVTKKWEFTYW